jgi:hypothetical protein
LTTFVRFFFCAGEKELLSVGVALAPGALFTTIQKLLKEPTPPRRTLRWKCCAGDRRAESSVRWIMQ